MLLDGDGIDLLVGGTGDDTFVLSIDGEVDEVHGGEGQDTLDLSNVVFDATISLPDGWFSVDDLEEAELFEIENITGGFGNDRLVADGHVNILTGGAGNDLFVFRSLGALTNEGGPRDHIMDFSVGDRIDLAGMSDGLEDDIAGKKLFFAGAPAATAEAIGAITFDQRFLDDGHEITVVMGQLDTDGDPDFQIVLDGHHDLTEHDFILAINELNAQAGA